MVWPIIVAICFAPSGFTCLALESSPEYMLRKAVSVFKEETGYTFKAMGELEYYVISEDEQFYEGIDQKGYHSSTPYAKWEMLRVEAMKA